MAEVAACSQKGFTLSTKREWCDLSPSPSLQVNSARTELYCLTFLFFPCKTAPGHFVLSQTKRSKTAAHLSLVSSIFLIFPSFCSLKSTELKFRLWIWKNVAMLLYRYKKKKKTKKALGFLFARFLTSAEEIYNVTVQFSEEWALCVAPVVT